MGVYFVYNEQIDSGLDITKDTKGRFGKRTEERDNVMQQLVIVSLCTATQPSDFDRGHQSVVGSILADSVDSTSY